MWFALIHHLCWYGLKTEVKLCCHWLWCTLKLRKHTWNVLFRSLWIILFYDRRVHTNKLIILWAQFRVKTFDKYQQTGKCFLHIICIYKNHYRAKCRQILTHFEVFANGKNSCFSITCLMEHNKDNVLQTCLVPDNMHHLHTYQRHSETSYPFM